MIGELPARVALVTGGGSGIGAATAAALRSSGWQVAICGRRQPQLDAVADSTGALTIAADVSVPEDARRVVRGTVEHFGRLDGLVLNAGIVRPGPGTVAFDPRFSIASSQRA